MKKILIVLMAALLMLTAVACKANEAPKEAVKNEEPQEAAKEERTNLWRAAGPPRRTSGS